MPEVIRIATRKSPLAIWQAQFIAQQLQQAWPELSTELIPMQTSGDAFLKDKLLAIGNKGLFVKELEEALLQNRADIAVHSMKDVPSELPAGLEIGAIPTRANPYDALISHHYPSLESMPLNAQIGTASLRRQSQLLAYRPDFNIHSVRGNIQTRIEKIQTQGLDGIILAVAGLERMHLQHHIQQVIAEHIMLPACGQGALGIEYRSGDTPIQKLIAAIHDPISAVCVEIERNMNQQLGGNCHVPVAVYCHRQNDKHIQLRVKVLSPDGRQIVESTHAAAIDAADSLVPTCAEHLFSQGAQQLLNLS